MAMAKDEWKRFSQSEIFVALVQIVSEKADLKAQLVGILRMESEPRRELLEGLIADLKAQETPRTVVKAIEMLLEDAIARQTLDFLDPRPA
jgi:hypothetical protein